MSVPKQIILDVNKIDEPVIMSFELKELKGLINDIR